MCDIWEKKPDRREELGLETIARILRSKCAGGLRHIGLTGGEPFLREDLAGIYSLARRLHPDCRITISSNGTLPDAMAGFFSGIDDPEKICLEWSLPGLPAHDVKARFPALQMKAKFVITPWNFEEIGPVARYCAERGLPLLLKLIENVKSYTNSLRHGENLRDRSFVFSPGQRRRILSLLKDTDVARIAERAPLDGVVSSLSDERLRRRCLVPARSLFVNSDGTVYRCRNHEPIGNARSQDLDALRSDDQDPGSLPDGTTDICGACSAFARFLT